MFKLNALKLLLVLLFINFIGVAQNKSTDSQLASKYFKDKEYEKAAVLYEKLYENSGSRIYFGYYFDCLLNLEDYKRAEKLIKKHIRRNPGELVYYVDYGKIYQQQEQFEKAEKKYNEAIEQIGKSDFQVISLANAFLQQREFKFAEKTYLQARKQMNSNPFYEQLAMVYAYQRDYEKMIAELLDLIEVSPNRLQSVQSRLQSAIVNDPDQSLRKILKTNLLERIQQNKDLVVYNELLIWLYVQEKNFKGAFIQVKAIDRRHNEQGKRVVDLAELAMSNGFYDVAIEAYQYVVNKGDRLRYFYKAKFGILDVYYKKVINGQISTNDEILALESNYKQTIKEFGRSTNSIRIIKDLAHLQAFYLDKAQDAIDLLEASIHLKGVQPKMLAECKIELGDIYLLVDEVWDATLTYAEVEEDFKHDPIGHEARFRKAKLAYYTGDFQWAQAQLDVLKASTSKLIANDAFELSLLISDNTALDTTEVPLRMFSAAELLILQNKDSLANLKLDSLQHQFKGHSLSDDILMQKAVIASKNFDWEKEIAYLQKVVDNHSSDILADNALFRIAAIFELKLHDKEKAMELYQKLMVDFKGSIFTTEARKRFRALRGDKKDKTDDFFEYNQKQAF